MASQQMFETAHAKANGARAWVQGYLSHEKRLAHCTCLPMKANSMAAHTG